ncbi:MULTISPECIES: hypothetical protein [Aerococcus]|uniref:Uncharacterized protein n=1 Tax=Aerococcus sanguinicola TaxID=119206 RepID=A0A5N1GRA8_9LACT|nr:MULTISPECIES: hypothetical protein [Aerococcus]KAA9301230.1 hypothetical protein F6I03_05010 [Aerococcus sanguinicola]MDK6369234.1 hypothetical protein [Aerococcus sp. UMB9870]MDK6679058.1 hypothetical protein [Aerococcus sp. UMB8608]MDK6686966.1 hypothetical protein [Aerococcus sp. UMB8623]MDK6940120.1 hypothetical protein [Aerococcus sp. UMB8487]
MNKNLVGTLFSLLCIGINIYIMVKGRSKEGMTAMEQARLKTVSGIMLLLAFIALTFGQYLGLE